MEKNKKWKFKNSIIELIPKTIHYFSQETIRSIFIPLIF